MWAALASAAAAAAGLKVLQFFNSTFDNSGFYNLTFDISRSWMGEADAGGDEDEI